MIDVNKSVREAFMQALDGTVISDGVPVPAYHEENPNESEDVYIILNQQTEEDSSNKGQFVTVGTILIDVVHRTDGYTYDVVDEVANGIFTILQPTPQTHGLTAPPGVQLYGVRRLSSTPLTIGEDSTNYMRRVIRYEYRAVEL